MTKSLSRRYLSFILVIVMVLTLVPAFTVPVWAAAVNTGVTGLSANSSGSATWSYSNGTINGSVTASESSGCTGTTYSARNGTLTFSNNSGGAALLSFNYALTLSGGSAKIDGTDTSAGGSFSKKLDTDDTVAVEITSNAANSTISTTPADIVIKVIFIFLINSLII